MDVLEVAKNFGIPVLGAIAGVFGSALHYRYRLEQVERDLETFKREQQERHKAEQQDVRAHVETLRAEFTEKLRELGNEVQLIDTAFTQFERASGHDFAKDAELARFIEEQNKQWHTVHRLLGQIEGILKSRKRWSSIPPSMNSR